MPRPIGRVEENVVSSGIGLCRTFSVWYDAYSSSSFSHSYMSIFIQISAPFLSQYLDVSRLNDLSYPYISFTHRDCRRSITVEVIGPHSYLSL